jgi:hypothetical protein
VSGANTKSMGADGSSQYTNVCMPGADVCVVGVDGNASVDENNETGAGGIVTGADVKKAGARAEAGVDGKS